jgi:hypothetical protein
MTGRDDTPTDASGLRWRLNRLRTMGPAEVAWRARQVLAARLEAAGLGRIPARPPQRAGRATRWLPQAPRGVDAAPLLRKADAVLAGRFDVFALEGVELGFPPQWNRDPRTGKVAPLAFGKTLDYRDASVVGDIKYLWEPARHLELVTLAQAHALTGDRRYAEGAMRLLESWFEQCPYPLGVHWTSSLELAVRLVNWSAAWQLLDAAGALDSDPALAGRWLGEVYRHQRFVAGHLSRHSSANNHLFGECMGLFVAAATWPFWDESAVWLRSAQSALEREAQLQNGPDGVNLEQGIWYHHEVADMMLLTTLAGRAAGRPFSDAYAGRLQDMLGFVAGVMDVGGNVPMFGDSDDAVMVRFDPAPSFDAYRSLLATGAVLFGRGDFARRAGRLDPKSRWLLGDAAARTFERVLAANPEPEPMRQAFPHGGYWVLGDRLGEPDELRLVVDAGPLGYLSIAAHGHADALSFTLSAHGREILIDPGTYAYHTQRTWRDYFKGTSAHNTVRVDGVDQSVSGGNFMWLRHARSRCEAFAPGPEADRFTGSHDGYRRLASPVTHRRHIVLHKPVRRVEVTDLLVGDGEHEVEVFWHFAESCRVRLEDGVVTAETGNTTVVLRVGGARLDVELARGRDNPPLGWVSRRFDRKEPIWCARWHGRVPAGVSWTTTFDIVERQDCDGDFAREAMNVGAT